MIIIVVYTGHTFKILARDDDRYLQFRNHRFFFGRHAPGHQDDPGDLVVLHQIQVTDLFLITQFRVSQKGYITGFRKCIADPGHDGTDRIRMDLGNNHADLPAPACPHGPGHQVRPVAGNLYGFSYLFSFLIAQRASVDITAHSRRGHARQLRNFLNSHSLFLVGVLLKTTVLQVY